MGGNAFPDLSVPRLPQHLYDQISSKALVILEMFYHQAMIPPEAPGKVDYGDVDILVEGHLRAHTIQDVTQALEAQYTVTHGNTTSYAIPHPEDASSYVQIDVETCSHWSLIEWNVLMKSYGDMMQIIGMSHRPVGITFNDKGMHVRVECIEAYNRQESMICLTRDPTEAVHFLGLHPDSLNEGFQTQEDLLRWIVSGRFFNPEHVAGHLGNTNDRQRIRKRPMFNHFVFEWLPNHLELAAGMINGIPKEGLSSTRGEILTLALNRFTKFSEYHEKMAAHNARERELNLQLVIKKLLPYDSKNSVDLACKGLRKFVLFSLGVPYIVVEPLEEAKHSVWSRDAFDKQNMFDESNEVIEESQAFQLLKHWVLDNCDTVLQMEMDRVEAEKAKAEAKKAWLRQLSEDIGILEEDLELTAEVLNCRVLWMIWYGEFYDESCKDYLLLSE